MAWSLVASTVAQSTDNQNVTTSAINTTGASLIVIHAATGQYTPSGLTDSKGNTILNLTGVTGAAGTVMTLYYILNPTTGAGHTFTYTGLTNHFPSLVVQAWGQSSPTYDSTVGTGTFSATSLATGALTPARGGALVVVGACIATIAQGAPSCDSGVTTAHSVAATLNAFGIGSFYKTQTGVINPTISWTGSGGASVQATSFLVGGGISGYPTYQVSSIAAGAA